jgi:hypothetical protein
MSEVSRQVTDRGVDRQTCRQTEDRKIAERRKEEEKKSGWHARIVARCFICIQLEFAVRAYVRDCHASHEGRYRVRPHFRFGSEI